MKKWKFIGKERRFIANRWLNPNDVIEAESKPNTFFEEFKDKKMKKGEKENVMES